ncbi:uncharacterized protein LOC107360785 [Tetranychus urticae]|uniref:Uncharacterized protein n=1 Tax=Tetranychus urticae TaxID=32264 RepID=T1K5Q1_TETUR|nr:uncharacterized protein LOC107360785 [Tetranychus urticae]
MEKLVEQFEQLKVTTSSRCVDDDPSIKELIETYSKAVLDCTFFHENYLTENNFCLESTEEDIATTLSLLNAIVSLCASVDSSTVANTSSSSSSSSSSSDSSDFGRNVLPMSSSFQGKTSSGDPYRSVVNVLGIEFGECVLWRQGSLLYAFCSAKLSSDPTWVSSRQMTLLKHLKDGINYFHLMLSLRRNLLSNLDEIDASYIRNLHAPRQLANAFNHHQYQDNIAYVSAKDLNPSNMNELGKLLGQKEQIVGALGQELDELQQVLDQQELLNIEARREIQQKMLSNPECRDDLERALDEIDANQQKVKVQQEANVEKKGQIENCLRQLRKQQDELNKQSIVSNPFTSGTSSSDMSMSDGTNVNTFDLIDMGVLSDTHMLAMMYCGDMAFWFCKYSRDWSLIDHSGEIFGEIRRIGISYLKIYIKAVEKVLKFSGWNCDRAKELLNHFNDL